MLSYVSLGLLLVAGTAWAKAPRIVGGEATTIEEYPYIVQMDTYSSLGGVWSQSCGANILTSYWIMSAAHCFEGPNYSPEYRRFRAGSTYRNSGGVIHYVEYEINHPDYARYARYDSDINVVKISTPLLYTPVVQKGTLITHDTDLPDRYPVIHAGWGDLTAGGSPPRELHHVQMYTINRYVCAQRYSIAGYGDVTKNMICAGLLYIGGRDACQGDSGGPLYAQGEKNHVIVGVASWGYGCANETFPGLSTRVASFTNWVIDNAK